MMDYEVLLLPHVGPAWPTVLVRSATSTPVFLGGARPVSEGSQTERGLKPLRQAPGPGVGGAGRWGMGRKGQEEMGAARSGPC